MGESWNCIWGMAHADFHLMLPRYRNSTMRLSVVSNLSGSALRVSFSNKEGKDVLKITEANICVDDGTVLPLRFNGQAGTVLQIKEIMYSDPVIVSVQAGSVITLKAAFDSKMSSGNQIPVPMQYSKKGNFVNNRDQFPIHGRSLKDSIINIITPVAGVENIDILTAQKNRVIVCFGDSITQQSHWTQPLFDMFLYNGDRSL